MDSLLNYTPNTDAAVLLDRSGKIHIRVQQRGKKWMTTLEGLDKDLDLHRISKAIAKAFHCSTAVRLDDDENEVIKIQGNVKEELREWLVKREVISELEEKERLVVHGA
jgi:translation initiation factor 1